MIYGYARVSTDAQDLGNQLAQLKAAGCEKIFRDKLTGAHAERPQLQTLLRTVTQGDVVLVAAVDRLSRDTTDLLVIARDLEKAGAGLRSLAEPLIDTTSDFKELILAIFGIAAKLERRRIIDRTARGRADAKAKGVKFGRKPKLTPHQKAEAIKRRDKDGETLRSIARSYNVSAQTIGVAARNRNVADAQSRAVFDADSLRRKGRSGARYLRLSARSVRRTRDRESRRTIIETDGGEGIEEGGSREKRAVSWRLCAAGRRPRHSTRKPVAITSAVPQRAFRP